VTDRPAQAQWLTAEERGWLTATLDGERRLVEARHQISLLRSFWDPKVLLLSLNYVGIVTASLGLLFFLPQMIKQLGFTNMQVGWATMIPYFCGAVSMIAWGLVSDRMGERRFNLFWACVVATIGLVLAGSFAGTPWMLVGISIAAVGFYGSKGPFWAMPPVFLTGSASAAGIAWINSLGNVGGTVGPFMVGLIKDHTGSFAGGLYSMAGFTLLSAVVAALWLHTPRAAAAKPQVAVAAE
jgi:ACS family tartrate transporter-like MFS transporter